MSIIKKNLAESFNSIFPIALIVIILSMSITPLDPGDMVLFLIGSVFLVFGMSVFTMGAEMSMLQLGSKIGSKVAGSGKIWLITFISFIIGILITVSEPDLQILATQVPDIENFLLIITVSVGVGIFLAIALIRILFGVSLQIILLVFYIAAFVLAFFLPESFRPLAFDSGGVTTGPMTVPFIMSLGVGVASIRADEDTDSFGLIALCSVGPIIAIMLLVMLNDISTMDIKPYDIPTFTNSRDIFWGFIKDLPVYAREVGVAVAPIVVFFLVFRAATGGLGTKGLGKILVGVLYTFVGLTLFLTGVNVGFMPLGNLLGEALADTSWKWLIVPIGMIIGYFIVSAEPAVHVLTKQVEDETSGAIPGKVLSIALSVGVAISVGIAMLRVLTGIPILYVLIPGYAIAIILTFVVPDVFTSIAFDSGGVASGPMTATFLWPFAVGACSAVGGNTAEDAFGVVAMVAMTPLITIQILGLVYKLKMASAHKHLEKPEDHVEVNTDGQIVMNFDTIANDEVDKAAEDARERAASSLDDDVIDF